METGYEDPDFIEVTSGLDLGQRVVRVGQGALKEGSRWSEVAPREQPIAGSTDAEDPGDTAMVRD